MGGGDGEGWDELERQLQEALRAQGIDGDPELEEAIAEGLREVLDALAGVLDGEDGTDEAPGPPPVTVVEGGGEAAGRPARPDLRVARPDEEAGAGEDAAGPSDEGPFQDGDGDGEDGGSAAGAAAIPVIRVTRRGGRWHASALGGARREEPAGTADAADDGLRDGWIACRRPDAWQTVFSGAEARGYRLACSRGRLKVLLDGVPADDLEAGQSMDVEARLVRVAAVEAPATGRYRRLDDGAGRS